VAAFKVKQEMLFNEVQTSSTEKKDITCAGEVLYFRNKHLLKLRDNSEQIAEKSAVLSRINHRFAGDVVKSSYARSPR
jgi:hypothetical protein